MKKVILAAAFVLTATSAAFAQYGAPGYGYGSSPPGWFENNTERGGPGPRVGAGSGMGIGSQR
jgi:hypothetical protein